MGKIFKSETERIGSEVARTSATVVADGIGPRSDASSPPAAPANGASSPVPNAAAPSRWRQLEAEWGKLSKRFRWSLASAILLLAVAVPLAGNWLDGRVQQGVVHNSAELAAVFMRSFIEPEIQELQKSPRLSAETTAKLDKLFASAPLKDHVFRIELRHADASVVYSTDPDRLGKKPPAEPEMEAALAGNIAVELRDAHHDQSEIEKRLARPVYEIYTPLYAPGTDRVVGAAEFYQVADGLYRAMYRSRFAIWTLLATLTFATLASMTRVTLWHREQALKHDAMQAKAEADTANLTAQNEVLSDRVEQVRRLGMEIGERSLRRIGADLHDGPAQLLGLVLLKLDELVRPLKSAGEASGEALETLSLIKRATTEALSEIRNTARGLVLPNIEQFSLTAVLELAATAHAQRTGIPVKVEILALPPRVSLPVTVALFRFVQEALNNAFRHAGGVGQTMTAAATEHDITVTVSDTGPGFDTTRIETRGDKLGLAGLRERLETLGGSLDISSGPGHGTTLTARLPLARVA